MGFNSGFKGLTWLVCKTLDITDIEDRRDGL